ncbi:MAG: patatin-like protein [Alphaproteobacteria bacterium]|nr:MAG: patatin-like protein [Alphaproteobacteria bacterium]
MTMFDRLRFWETDSAKDESGFDEGQPALAREERELRLALVCYGGVSLAVYMYGISREVVGLVRASQRLHRHRDGSRRKETGEGTRPSESEEKTAANGEQPRPLLESERIYHELLAAIGPHICLRVVVDVVAGASAGGINAIMLARALAFDQPLERHRDFWLRAADVEELLDPSARAGIFSKAMLYPLFWLYGLYCRFLPRRNQRFEQDPEVLRKLSLFVRSRWFHPPFSGRHMCMLMLDALEQLPADPGKEEESLIPIGLPLDVFVTATDFWGHPMRLVLDDPHVVEEREHRRVFHFRHLRRPSGRSASGLGSDHDPGLAFAARATSSFPGIYPPAHLDEMDETLRARGEDWPARDAFLKQQFDDLLCAGHDPREAAFIDGSVLMNKPISIALKAIEDHAAHREVDRRLVYVEPKPACDDDEGSRDIPGFFRTIRAALAEIPRKQPIRDDLEWLTTFNDQLRLVQEVTEAVKPRVIAMVGEVLGLGPRLAPRADRERLAGWRRKAHQRAAREADYAYDGYVRLKLRTVLDELARHFVVTRRCGLENEEEIVRAQVEEWARRRNLLGLADPVRDATRDEGAAWIAFLRDYDLGYRIRRLRFLVRRLNELYEEPLGREDPSATRAWIDRAKFLLYQALESHLLLLPAAGMPPESANDERPMGQSPGDAAGEWSDARVAEALAEQAARFSLEERDTNLDRLLAECLAHAPSRALARELLTAYLGFAYYDVVSYPMIQGLAHDELQPIKVDRIAVDDAPSLHPGGAREVLKGIEFETFAAFFSRRYRENDYLWGRLTAAERLVDIVLSAAPEARAAGGIDIGDIKKRLFRAILEEERPHLPNVPELFAELERRIEEL